MRLWSHPETEVRFWKYRKKNKSAVTGCADKRYRMFEVPELNAMVQEVNETQVERQEQLSDKVQFCDGKTAVMENAERREARLEKEKAAEKATGRTEAKGGIHGKLEKAKAEIKAKGTDTIPKNRAKDLASVL